MTTSMQQSTASAPGADGAPLDVRQASPREVRAWLDAGSATLVDVREPDEHARERIPAARLVALSNFDPARALQHLKPGQSLVLHCRSGKRSLDAANRAAPLAAANNVPLYNMTGGIEAWKQDSLPVQTDTSVARISLMRQVQLVIGAGVVTGAALAWFVHPAFLAIPAFFGAGLIFAGATGTCGLAALLSRMPWNRASRASCAPN